MINLLEQILKDVIDFYKNSQDFNGIPLLSLLRIKADKTILHDTIKSLIVEGKISVCHATNSHIKSFPDEPVHEQLSILETIEPSQICIYPTEKVLDVAVDSRIFADKPFTRMLALGKPQLMPPLFFDTVVLENYFSDPRYYLDYYDYGGSISYNGEMEARDQVLLQSFGLGYRKKDRERVVAVHLRYLSDLTPEHQQRWKTYLIEDDCVMAYPYYQNSILGEWASNASIYQAFLEEIVHINEMLLQAFGKKLFLNDYKSNRPDDFKIILRPTLENYNKFVHCLDKLMSDNIAKTFFDGEVAPKQANGQNKGTVTLLNEWLRRIRVQDEKIFDEIIKPFREVRELRQKPAHKVNKNQFDKEYFKLQDKLIKKSYIAVRDIRLLLSNHPKLSNYKVPDWLFDGRISIY